MSTQRRMRVICEQCRLRKVRCDGSLLGCGHCRRLGFQCSFVSAGEASHTSRHPPRCRAREACTNCRRLKIRCSGQFPVCRRCREKRTACEYPSRTADPEEHQTANATPDHIEEGFDHRDVSITLEPVNTSSQLQEVRPASTGQILHGAAVEACTDASSILTEERAMAALERYFHYLYPLPSFAFLHRASLTRRCLAGQADDTLLLSIIAISSRLPGVALQEELIGRKSADLAQSTILRDPGRPSVVKTQALLLIILYRIWLGSFSEAFVLMATLTRFAFALRINYENPNVCFLAQESRRRLMWAIYILDTMLSAGLPEFTLCSSNVVYLHLPCLEENFELDNPCLTETLLPDRDSNEKRDIGLLAFYVRIIYLRDQVLRYTKRAASSGTDNREIPLMIQKLSHNLDDFSDRLPSTTSFSEKNLYMRTFSRWFPRYIMIHMWWNQCYCDLFRCLLPNFRESISREVLHQLDPGFVFDCRVQCLQHARAISFLCSLILQLDVPPFLNMHMAECAYQAAHIILRSSSFGIAELPFTDIQIIEHATLCLQFIQWMSTIYQNASSIASDLEDLIKKISPSLSSKQNLYTEERATRQVEATEPSSKIVGNQIISRHSMLNRSNFVDDSAGLDISVDSGTNSRRLRQDAVEPRRRAANLNLTSGLATYSSSEIGLGGPTHSRGTLRASPLPADSSGPEGDDWWDQSNAFQGALDEVAIDQTFRTYDVLNTSELFPGLSGVGYNHGLQ